MCSCSSRIVVLTPTLLCCAALLRPQIAVWLHPTASLLCPRSKRVQPTAPSTAHCWKAPLATLAVDAQQAAYLRISVLQPTSAASHHPGQLRFREELMHELLKQLPAESTPRKSGAGLHPAHALANEHFSSHSEEKRDCAQCSSRPHQRVQTHYICAACKVHLCIGGCFAQYHS
jgi:hypothetical protein